MNLTIDTSAIIAVIANESTKSEIISATQGMKLFAPKSVHWEIANAMSAMFKLKAIDLNDSKELIDQYNQIPITFVDVDLATVLKISYTHKIYAYDAYILQCALQKQMPILTLDNGLKTIARLMDIKLLEV